ncbi:MAG: rhomboid family intramembrane serine protease [Mycobacteriaceae bacterium]
MPYGPDGGAVVNTCYRHPDRPTGLRCARCGRPACPECLREAAVGFQCVECVHAGQRDVRRPTTMAGATRTGGRPIVTEVLVALNVVVFAISAVLAQSLFQNQASALFARLTLFPLAVADGQWYRLVSSAFLHFGPVHIALNMYALYVLGRELESVLGRGRYVAVYLVSLLGGSASVMVFQSPFEASAGASGAVFGVLGGLAVVIFRLKRNPTAVLAVIAINLVFSVAVPNISLSAHLGGLVVGAAATAAIVWAPARSRTPVQVGALVALSLALVVVIVVRALSLRAQVGL